MILSSSAGVPRADLAGVMIQRTTEMSHFVGLDLMPILHVNVVSGRFYKIAKARAHKIYDTLKRPFAAPSRSEHELEADTYSCDEYMHDEPVDRWHRRVFGEQYNPDQLAAENCALILMRDLERRILAELINNTNFPLSGNTGLTVSNAWNSSSGTPVTDINTALEAFRARGAPKPDLLVLGEKAADGMASNPEILNRIKYVASVVENPRWAEEQLAKALGIDRVRIARSRVNTANDGITASLSPQLGVGDAFLAVTSNRQSFQDWQLGRTVHFTQEIGGMFGASSGYDRNINADIVRGETSYDVKLISSDCGFRFASVAS